MNDEIMNEKNEYYRLQLLVTDKDFKDLEKGDKFVLLTIDLPGTTIQTVIVYEKNKPHTNNEGVDETHTIILNDEQFRKLTFGEEVNVLKLNVSGQIIIITLKRTSRKRKRDKLLEHEADEVIEATERELAEKVF